MHAPPPPQAVHKPAPETNNQKSAENYSAIQKKKVTNRLAHLPHVDNALTFYNAIPDKRSKHTNRLHSRKQTKMRAKRKARR